MATHADPADALFALDARFGLALDGLDEDFARSLTVVLRALQVRVNELVRQLEREGGRIVSTQVNLGLAQRAKQQLEQALVDAGAERLVTEAYAALPSLVQFTDISRAAQAFSAFDLATLEAYRTLKTMEMTGLFTDSAERAYTVILKGVMGAQSERELVAELMDVFDETQAHAQTLYETGMSEFVQTCTALHADGTPDEAFVYSGPIDGRIRPFCLARVGRVFTREAIDAMNNGQLNNTFLTRGGYNCRHQFRRVSQYSDLKPLANTGQFANERLAGDVARVEAAQKARPRRPDRKAA